MVLAEIALAVLAWRDLSHLSDDRVRGSRRIWRIAIIANPGNSIVYWMLGRRSADPTA